MQNEPNNNSPYKKIIKPNSTEKNNEESLENIFRTEYKTNRVHRLSPQNLSNIPEEQNSNKNLNFHYRTPSNKKKKREIDEEIYKEEVTKEINKRKNIYKEFIKIYSEMKLLRRRNIEEEIQNSFNEINQAEKNKKEEIYYIINRTWFNQFRNYCAKINLSYSNINEDYPGQINNQHLILKDDSCLKLYNEDRIIINTKYLDNCVLITQNMWQFLVEICGGGPEIKYILNKNNEITIKKAVHINLIFLPKKQIISNNNNKEPSNNSINPLNPFLTHDIKKILKNMDNNKIKIEKIYFDSFKNVKELINYINQILNQHRNKFTNTPIIFGPSFTLEETTNIENINYRLWLLILNNKIEINTLSNIIEEYISKNEDVDFPLNFPQLNNNLNEIYFHPYLLTNFLSNKVCEIFPNKYSKNFNHKDYNKIEDENTMPEINILIEEFPYHFQEPKKEYTIKKCSQCHYKDFVFSGCQCGKAFYCSDECKKKNFNNHLISCNISLFNYLAKKNENLYRTIKGRKEFFEKENINILGLTNLGNSCYMNSALQCLFATKELSNFFLYNFNNDFINKDNILGSGGLLTLGYINLLLNINNTSNNRYISPDNFKIILGKCSAKFEGNEQEDAHEFINYLLDVLHEDLNRVKEKPNNINNLIKYKNKQISEEEKSIIDWNNFLIRNQSVLIDLFYGQLKSCVICPNCNYNSINFNSFLSLELSIIQNKNYHCVNIDFIDYYKESPNINFNIVLYNKENKVYHLRKKIANLLDIDLLSFELGIVYDNKIIHIYDLNDEINNTIISIVAYRINPEFFYSEKNGRYVEILHEENINENNNNNNINSLYNKYKIDFNNLEQNVYKRKNDIIKFNQSDNDAINKDLLSFSLLYHDNIGLDNSYFQRFILENFLIRKGGSKNLDIDEIIYLEKEKTCKEIYYEIFKKNALSIIVQNIRGEERDKFIEIYNSNDIEELNNEIRKKFEKFFKEEINNELRPSKLSIKNNFPDCPFILILKNEKNNILKIIPFSPNINFQELLNKFKEEIEIKINNQNQIMIPQNEKEIKNNYILFEDLMNEITKENNNNKNKKNNGKKEGLKGGERERDVLDGDEEKPSSESENENEENSEETDNNENNDNYYNNEYSNSERELNSLNEGSIGSKSISSGYDINTPSTSPIKNIRLKDEEKMILFKLKNEKDENTGRIIVIWNNKYIKELGRFRDINLYDICDKIYEKSTNQGIKLEKLFEEFSKEEKLDKENLYKCENCKKELEANKKIEIYHIPKILIIHLKRFNNNKKINTYIEFPLNDLDIKPFIKSGDNVSKYDLFGVINHFGSLEYGHYTSFCLNYKDNNWYEYNDRIANKIQKGKEKEVIINKNAYILFYRCQDNDNINWDLIYHKPYEIIDENNLKKYGDNFVYNEKEENKIIIEENNIQKKEEKITEDKNDFIVLDDNDDNFSFKEGMNNRTISNITNEENNESISSRETPKFKNKTEIIEDKNNLINFNLNEIKDEPKECKTENKKTDIFNGVKITSANTFKILTYMKPRKKELKENNKNNKIENELLQYNIFNQSRKYFNLNQKKINKGINSVKNKELSLFLLKEISDNKTNKVPRSKKLYDEIENTINTEKEQINNNEKKEDIIEINSKIKEMNLNDYVYNPFKNCYLKLKKF